MKEIKEVLNQLISQQELIQIVMSNMRQKNDYNKVTIHPFLSKDSIMYQVTYHYDQKVTHENYDDQAITDLILSIIEENAKQIQVYGVHADYQILVSKKMKIKIITQKATKQLELVSHNDEKKYIIPNNEKCDFLIRLGVMDEKGRVRDKSYSKFRQINRYLEIVRDAVDQYEVKDNFGIIDFGCGKSYLTFAVYWYLVEKLNYNVKIVGLDLKEDVVKYCNEVAEDLSYDGLSFLIGDIKDYDTNMDVNMVITLHACDTATDEALIKSVGWDADIILSVPCCQHELFSQIKNETMMPMLQYGVQKDRVTAMVTDTLRTLALEVNGYKTQMVEFIDMEHTSKNIMIKAGKISQPREEAKIEYSDFKEFWHVNPRIDALIKK